MNYTETLAKYGAALAYETIPEDIVRQCKEDILDYLSCAYGGGKTDSGRIAAEFARDFSEKGQCTVVGQGCKSAPYNAAMANAILSHSIELDDVDILAYFHTGPQTVSAALAAAEWAGADGKTFLAGVELGSEYVNRISEATNPSLRNRGFHTTPTCGVFGAAAAAGRILGLGYEQMVSCLGLAGAQASGLMEMYGQSMQKRFNPGPAARNGVTAALFAQRGFTGAETILEGERGFCRAFADEAAPERLTADLGKDFRVSFEYKPYSCARPIHNAIDCALAIRKQHEFNLDDVKSMVCKRHPEWALYHDIKEPKSYHMSQVSLPYSVAAALTFGKALFDEYDEVNLKNESLMRLCRMLVIEPEPSLPRGVSCRLFITLKDGRVLDAQVDYPKGSYENPMTDQEHYDKFVNLSGHKLSPTRQREIFDLVWGLEKITDISELTRLLV
ncbi:MAG: MmgE/PrpD family protein [Gracilibacteraceae bacterium]|jgi:2-methylcitrate dehydratase PrpD|nr:MmgE/PrpD family protein [Gracilibacteraceae bacterium]